MKRARIHFSLCLLATLLLFYSCQSELLEVDSPSPLPKSVLGKKLENPYSLKNMQLARQHLVARSGSAGSEAPLAATHLYVRFLPKDKAEYLLLKEKYALELFSYPLDREVTVPQTDYHDPSLSAEQITWQYTRVPADFSFPNVEYEILDQLYMPWIEEGAVAARSASDDDRHAGYQALIDEAFALAGYSTGEQSTARNGDFNVSVPILINAWDDELQGYVPVKGVKVKLTGFTEWGTAYTDASGFALFNGKAISTAHRIDISWENSKDWYIFSGNSVATLTGPYVTYASMYHIDLQRGNPSLFYASIHRALHNFYNNSFGIRYPSLPYYYLSHGYEPIEGEDNSWMQRRVHVAATSSGGNANLPNLKTIPDPDDVGAMHITIHRYQENTPNAEHSTTSWFAMTTHETAHLAHICHYNISRADQGVMESWARAVEVTLTNEEVRRLTGINSFKHEEDYQGMNIIGDRSRFILGYTPVFIDCMDSYNQYDPSRALPMDRVSGYTLQQIESCLSGTRSIYDVKEGLKQRYSNPTSQYLDELFGYYNGVDFYIY